MKGFTLIKLSALTWAVWAGSVAAQKAPQLALTPLMGWNSWNHFECAIDEKTVRQMADLLVSSGMKDAGYQYINIDDCWHGERDNNGNIQAHPTHFPSGIKALADYVHSKGLKLGIYSDAGAKTCAGKPGSRGYEYQDAKQYAQWGVDYLKYDWCNTEGLNAKGAYTTMRDALHATGKPIVLSICEWGDNKPWLWGKDIGHLWRTTGDIYNCWDCEHDHGTWSSWGVLKILDMQEGLRQYAGPGHWNDPDMMEVGNGMSASEDKAHFSLWAMLAAPLIAGNDLRSMSKETLAILSNKDVIAVDQDKLGIQAFKYKTEPGLEYFFKPLENGEWAMLILNRSDDSQRVRFDWRNEKVVDELFKRSADFATIEYKVKDLWSKQQSSSKTLLQLTIPRHDVVMYRLTPKP